MARRYSGNLTIHVEWDDRGYYRAAVVPHGSKRGWVGQIGHPPASLLSVDSPQAYDQTARAAIAFAGHEGLNTEGAEYGDQGPIVHRGSTGAAYRARRSKRYGVSGSTNGRFYRVINYRDSGGISYGPVDLLSANEAMEVARETPHSSIDVMEGCGKVLRTLVFSPKHPVGHKGTLTRLLMRD